MILRGPQGPPRARRLKHCSGSTLSVWGAKVGFGERLGNSLQHTRATRSEGRPRLWSPRPTPLSSPSRASRSCPGRGRAAAAAAAAPVGQGRGGWGPGGARGAARPLRRARSWPDAGAGGTAPAASGRLLPLPRRARADRSGWGRRRNIPRGSGTVARDSTSSAQFQVIYLSSHSTSASSVKTVGAADI